MLASCTWVVVSSCGILESVALRHSTVSLPPFHLQVQCWGQWPRVEDSLNREFINGMKVMQTELHRL